MEKEGEDFKEKTRGCLLGVAIGDALGAPFEHLWPGQSNQALDSSGGLIKDFHPYMGIPAGSWTDDTGMTLASCRAFVEMAKIGDSAEECHRRAFYDWAGSMECRRPGKTVLYAAKYGQADVDAWSNGALMRISPVAIYAHLKGLDLPEAATLAYKLARLSHGHPFATYPAVECVLALTAIFSGSANVPGDLFDPGGYCRDLEQDTFSRYSQYQEKRRSELESLHPSTGLRMWRQVFEQCLDLRENSPWSKMPGFEEGILKAVNESFDRDTAGAVAGALLGAYWGEKGIPEKWKATVEKADDIIQLADRFIQSQF